MPVVSEGIVETRRPIRFTPQDYHALADQGLLRTPTELVDGQIIEMPDRFYPEAVAVGRSFNALRAAWHDEELVVVTMTNAFPSGRESGRMMLLFAPIVP